MLAPSADLLSAYKSGRVSIKDYTRIYTSETLSRYNPIEMYNWIVSKHSDSAALLCYEKPGEFCHRRLVAEWLEQASNVSIEELAAPVRQSPALAITQLGPWVKS